MRNIKKAIKNRINGIGMGTIVTAVMLIAVSLWHQQNPWVTLERAMDIAALVSIPIWTIGLMGLIDTLVAPLKNQHPC